MVDGIKSLLTKVRGKAKLMAGAITAAVASSMVAITACAEETTDISTVITTAGASLKEQFVILVQTLVPVLIGIGVVGLGLYAVIYLFKMAKQFFAKAAG